MTKTFKTIFILSLLFLLFSPSLLFADEFYDAAGFNPHRETFTTVPYEHIDTFTGGVILNFIDARLPGNGGLDLVIQRTYNSKIWERVGSYWQLTDNSWIGLGWTLHFGRVIDPYGANPIIEMPDGSQHKTYTSTADSTKKITRDYWIYEFYYDASHPLYKSQYILTFTDGRKIYFAHPGPTINEKPTLYAIKITDANGNMINIYYKEPYASKEIIDYVEDTTGRKIYFYTSTVNNGQKLTRIEGAGIKFTYTHTSVPGYMYYSLLTSATPAVGNAWTYTYNTTTDPKYELTSFTSPSGGTITYTYSTQALVINNVYYPNFRAVKTRQASGRDVPSGTWNFSYQAGTSGDTTTITDPCSRTITYKHYGYGYNNAYGSVWKIGILISKSISGEETINYSWDKSGGISYEDECSLYNCDYEIWVPFLTSKSITRDGKTYTTNYSNYDSYANPKTISESGDKTRTTTITYWYNTSKNIVQNKPLSETVLGSFPGTFTTNYSYDSNGNLTQLNRYGVTTNYTYYNNGNLYTMTDANSNKTTYQWSNGRISKITNPIYSISRSINSNGTIASETNGRNYTTYFTYDGNLRLTEIDPPVGNTTYFTYPSDNSYKKESRGGYYIYHYYDGFGRASGTEDSKGVTTDIVYKSCGPKNYSTSNIGDTVYYDNFERVIRSLHKDNSDIEYSYSGSNITVTDEAGNNTYLTYNAFGSPDEKWLVNVKDSLNNNTAYNYNILGSLTNITQGSISRTFVYNTKNFLESEYHPEKGTITYTRDNVGNLKTKSESLGTTTYTYDGINRLKEVSYGTEKITFTYDDADNRTSMDNPSTSIDYTYDADNRLTKKVEIVLGRTYTTQYEYDGNDNLTDIYYPSNRYVEYTYNSNNQVTSVTGFGESITNITYYTTGSSVGLPKSFKYSNGLTTDIVYNNRNLTTQIKSGTSILDMRYGYDTRGNTTSISDYLNNFDDQTFSYDDLSRLLTFDGAWGTGLYTYNSTGNRLTKKVAGVTTNYNYSNNRLISTTGGETFSFDYNSDGDLITMNGYTLQYDRLHNLISYKQNNTPLSEFTYDGDGMRVTKTSDGKTIVYHYDKDGRVLSESDNQGNLISDYIYLNGKLAAKVANDAFIPPDAPANLTATAVSTSQINLSWTDNSTNETGFKIERKIGAAGTYTQIAAVGTNVTTYSDTGLTPDTTYYYRVRAYNAGGNSNYSNEANATTSTTPQSDISISPTSHNFGNVVIGSTSATQTFTVSNTGTANLVIGTITLTGTDASEFSKTSDSCLGQTITPSSSCAVQVIFSPTSEGAKSAYLSISSNDPDTPTLNAPITGTGVDSSVPDISISPTSHNFGNVVIGSTSATQTFTVSNTGTANLVIGTITLTGTDASEFSKTSDSCLGQTITPSSSCAVQVIFSPTSEGAKSAYLSISSNDPDTPTLNVSLSGTGVTQPAEAPVHLPKTGQMTSYVSGDDGNIQAGVQWPSPRFTDNGNETITDNLTGLMWLKDANCVKTNYPYITDYAQYGWLAWQETLTFIAYVNAGIYSLCGAGYNDWRLPNVNELESLFNAGAADPTSWLNQQGFINVQSFYYWTSTTHAYNTDWAWNWIKGSNGAGISKSESLHLWPVRGTTSEPAKLWRTGQTINYSTFPDDGGIRAGVEWPSPRFTINADTTVRDNLTGLVWSPDAGMPTVGSCTGGVKTWQEALNYVTCLNNNNYLGHNDWRLPNRKELYSLIDFSQFSPALPSGHPFTNVQSGYWSSTTDIGATDKAWLIGIWYGSVGSNSKGSNFYAWPVRGGIQIYLEESDPDIIYTGTWNTYACASCSGGALKYSGQIGAKADFSFNGTGIKWIVTRAGMMGMAKVYLDGVYIGLVDLYSSTPQYQVPLQKTGLTPGNHTVTIEVSGQKNPTATNIIINIDAFEVIP